jgi:hypothetical protein
MESPLQALARKTQYYYANTIHTYICSCPGIQDVIQCVAYKSKVNATAI